MADTKEYSIFFGRNLGGVHSQQKVAAHHFGGSCPAVGPDLRSHTPGAIPEVLVSPENTFVKARTGISIAAEKLSSAFFQIAGIIGGGGTAEPVGAERGGSDRHDKQSFR